MTRYAAKLLFQFRVSVDGKSLKRRLCEERIVVVRAKSARVALALAKRKGRASHDRYKNAHDDWVNFEFIGVMELLCLDPECEKDEVWYELRKRLLPSERRNKFIPPESKLNAI
jgi:hypothetical protein